MSKIIVNGNFENLTGDFAVQNQNPDLTYITAKEIRELAQSEARESRVIGGLGSLLKRDKDGKIVARYDGEVTILPGDTPDKVRIYITRIDHDGQKITEPVEVGDDAEFQLTHLFSMPEDIQPTEISFESRAKLDQKLQSLHESNLIIGHFSGEFETVTVRAVDGQERHCCLSEILEDKGNGEDPRGELAQTFNHVSMEGVIISNLTEDGTYLPTGGSHIHGIIYDKEISGGSGFAMPISGGHVYAEENGFEIKGKIWVQAIACDEIVVFKRDPITGSLYSEATTPKNLDTIERSEFRL